MFRKHLVLLALVLLAAVVETGSVVSGAAVESMLTRAAAHGRRATPAAASVAAVGLPSIDAPPTTQPVTPDTTPPLPDVPAQAPSSASPAQAPSSASPAQDPEPAATPSCSGGGSATLDAMNRDRAANGVGPVCGNNQLAGFAQNWANWMAQSGSFNHEHLSELIGSTPFHTMGENILVGPAGTSVAQMEAALMNSPEHRANILSSSFSAAGSGMTVSSDGQVWACVVFGG